ncbi:enamine deaminase RidA (plasmid) [Cryobacterium sp. LW097]|uniref:RidA family protein n=1 Tax=unclassified Cryobacterium TaxID=2649013 RepID=UPI000B4C7DE3|nr:MULTISPECIES: RidA family protein [unclassified Cryobacterium]ASD24254.1 enamine deaminase RidA [Cryobacterium sp. LW097]TFC52827.1 RidA family protein [Cryobacterium sp. TMB3-1-2]TFC62232.1 RidA family protein [Cryobacterium sp. TMB1-7]TFC70677.1 RidA family protein [Cryobacterium sp. TMB3-15]TFC75403.1 RidA family protein [Cryobacterium sp. TMB3-10]
MSLVQRSNPPSAVAPAGKYSHLSIVGQDTPVATFAGQIGATSTGTVPGSAAEQTRLVFTAIRALLDSQHAAPADLVKLTTYIVGRDNLPDFNAIRDEVYADWFPAGEFPPNTVLIVAGLAAPPLLVEIEGSFVCGRP